MSSARLISIAAGVSPELATNPMAFVEAAAQAGWPATGVWFGADSWTPDTMAGVKQRLDDSGMIVLDMEVVRMGSNRDFGEALVDTAIELGARNVLAISSFTDVGATAERFAQLCQRGAPAGLRICIEFMRFTTVRTLSDALEVIRLADQPNAGILVDLLHVRRSGTTFDEIRSADPALFPYVQWCDGPAEPRGWENSDLLTDALDDRSIPDEGDLAAREFEGLFAQDVPFSLEVRSKALRDSIPDPVERARHVLMRTKAALV